MTFQRKNKHLKEGLARKELYKEEIYQRMIVRKYEQEERE